MKNTIIATILFATVVASAHAVPGCDLKRSAQERAQCSEYAVQGGLVRMKKNYDIIMASKRVPQEEKDKIPEYHRKWAEMVDKSCSDNDCYYSNISRRNSAIEDFMHKYGLNPI